MIRQPEPGRCCSGDQGAEQSITRIASASLIHGSTPIVGEPGQCGERLPRPRSALGEDHRPFRLRKDLGGALNVLRTRSGDRRGHRQRRTNRLRGTWLAQHLAREAHVDRPPRGRVCDCVGPVDQLAHLLGEPQLVLPFRGLPDQGSLIAHLLTPADRHRPGTEPALLSHRRAAGEEQHRHVLDRRVDGADGAVGETDIRVGDDRLRAAGGEIVAVRHAHGRVLVRGYDGNRQRQILRCGFGQPLDYRRKIRAGVGKDIVDAHCLQTRQKRATRGDGRLLWLPLLHRPLPR